MSSNPIVLTRSLSAERFDVSINLIQRDENVILWETYSHLHETSGLTQYYDAQFMDQGRLEIIAFQCSIEGITNGFVCKIRSFSTMVCHYIYNLAVISDLIIFPSDPFATILVSKTQEQHLEANWEEKYDAPLFCDSAGALEPILAEGFFAWLNYRNRVMSENEG